MMISTAAARTLSRGTLIKAATAASTGLSLLQLSHSSSTTWPTILAGPAVVSCEQGDKDTSWQKALDKATQGLAGQNIMDTLGKTVGSQVQGVIDTGIPTQLSYGFVSGYCAGLAAKQVGKLAATVFGLGFMTLQTLAYNGYIEVNHAKIQESVEKMLDLNQDGKIDEDDATEVYQKALKVLQFNLPAGSGFAAGFLGGLRSG